ncbi:hypothetical protein ACFQZ4_16985 [Catellatospora coxensis]
MLERLRGLPLVATTVFTAALILLILTTVHRPATWNDALPWDTEPSAEPVAAPVYPDAPVANSPVPRTPGARPSTAVSTAASPAPSAEGASPSPAASPSPVAPPPPAPPRTARYEAESASRSQARTASDHNGFSGAGFVDYDNVTGGYLQWSVPGASGPPPCGCGSPTRAAAIAPWTSASTAPCCATSASTRCAPGTTGTRSP